MRTLWDNKVFLDKAGRSTQLVVNCTGEVIFEIYASRDTVKAAWKEYADKNGLIVLDKFNGDVKYVGKGAR